MSTWAEKKAALPPIDLSSIVFEDEEEDEDEYASSTSSTSAPLSSSPSLVSSPTSSSSSTSITSSSTSITSTSPKEPPARRFLEPTDRSTDFFWPMGIRPFELRGAPRLPKCFVPNNNDVDTIVNGPAGQVAPLSRPPDSSPKWGWKPKPTTMRQVATIVQKQEPTDRCMDFLWPMGIRPLELRGPPPPPLVAKAVVPPQNNGICEIVNGPKCQMVLVTRAPPNKSPIRDWEPRLTRMGHVWTMGEEKEEEAEEGREEEEGEGKEEEEGVGKEEEEEKEEKELPLPSPAAPVIESGNRMGLVVGAIGLLALFGLWSWRRN